MGGLGRIGFVTGLVAEARLLRRLPIAVAVGGGTPSGAVGAAESLVRQGATGLISFGLAGGLDPDLHPGTVIIPRSVYEAGKVFPCDSSLAARLGGISHEMIIAGDSIIGTVTGKSSLFTASGAVAVDLESGAVARVAERHGLPFAVLRAIADPAARGLPEAAMIALDARGGIALRRILLSLARHPSQLKGLIRLGLDARAASRALSRHVTMERK
jgi:adenosylhomocysteine nucleosidase